ncbi:translation initiation factor eIF-2B subunit alpha-like [Macrosteles quadrilineatus]|uniref:translation initiation factor eIF-2B subunit alpha-like n=1 Tax=Macrosteles quadrilineatus TaxID=74068 RepID=UPI0023E27BBA|nr:translation initiation factor eIF-2B subunit alpha-like [Macrosteles quadrilineatus]
MDSTQVEDFFSNIMKTEQETSAGIAAIRTLLEYLKHDESKTVVELRENLRSVIDVMTNTDYPTTAVVSGSELFLRFITLAAGLDKGSFEECKEIMIKRGRVFLQKLMCSRGRVAKLAAAFITDGTCILTHSRSRVVLQTMKEAADSHRRFKVYVTKSSPDSSGDEMAKELMSLGIPCTVILDSAVGYVMEHVDMVMVGAEGVMESGGIVNKVGSFTMALCAKAMNKPFYVLTESFKFARQFPLNQRDLPDQYKYRSSILGGDLTKEHPLVDYTPPSLITLLFTDLGILTPSAVSDELIKLYL